MLRIFTVDFGVFGCIVVAAESEEQAREIMADCDNYAADAVVQSQDMPTAAGLIHCNLGDT